MPYKIDYRDGDVYAWSLTDDGTTCTRVTDFTPSLYLSTPSAESLDEIRGFVDRLTEVVRTELEEWRTGWRHEAEPVLRIDVDDIEHVTTVASDLRRWDKPGTYKPYNVDFSREFRYCLETGTSPSPARDPTLFRIDVSEPELARDGGIHCLEIDGERIKNDPTTVASIVAERIASVDPDVLIVSKSDVIPALFDAAAKDTEEYQLGRLPGYQQLAGRSTYESYGRVGHSPARYNLPGRAIIDESNTFIYHKAGLAGLLDMVDRSWKPLQETAWASIGNLLTAIQIREAQRRNVLTPWNSWRHEFFKTARQLHEADRGGFIFSPDVGFHEDVHELDFSSLYPNIIATRNISPETIRCECHRGREDVPGLGYAICDEPGYLPDVLRPLIEDRDEIKAELGETEDAERRRELEGKADAIKWILVSCFGYQGFSNAKFGRIECHEAINAYAREILDYLSKFHYASLKHALIALLWETGMRLGAVNSLDIADVDIEDQRLTVRHRPDEGTELKNGSSGERPVAITPGLSNVLVDYIETVRTPVTDEFGREPLFSTSHGRRRRSSLRRQTYIATAPCFRNEPCDGCTETKNNKCPDAVSPHAIRRGSITHFLTEDVPVEIVEDRMNVSRKVLKRHYDNRSEEVKLEQRRGYLENI